MKTITVYTIECDADAKENFWKYFDFDEIFTDKEKALEYLTTNILEAFEEDEDLWQGLFDKDSKEKALKWWLKYHFAIEQKKVK